MLPPKNKFTKPKSTSVREADIASLIDKGGSTPSEALSQRATQEDGLKRVQLRIPLNLLKQIDQALEQTTVPKPRHTWILEAIYAKVEDEISGRKAS